MLDRLVLLVFLAVFGWWITADAHLSDGDVLILIYLAVLSTSLPWRPVRP